MRPYTFFFGMLFLAAAATARGLSAGGSVLVKTTSYKNLYLPGLYVPGTTIELERIAPSVNEGTRSFQWLHNDLPIPGANQPTFTLRCATPLDSGNYAVQVTGPSGTETSDWITLNFLPLPAAPVDPTFQAAPIQEPDGTRLHYSSVAYVYPDGRLIAATWDGLSTISRWVRLLQDGRLDPSFTFRAANHRVLAAFPKGGLVVSEPPYVLSPDGTAFSGFVAPEYLASGPSDAKSAAVLPDGRFFISRGGHIARFNADGSLDPAFKFSAVSTSTSAVIAQVALDSRNRVYVSVPTNSDPLVRLTASGGNDATFKYVPIGPRPVALNVRLLEDGRLLLTSNDSRAGVHRAIINDDGTIADGWTPFSPSTDSTVDPNAPAVYHQGHWPGAALQRGLVGAKGMLWNHAFYLGDDSFGGFTPSADGKLLAVQHTASAGTQLVRLLTDAASSLPPTPQITQPNRPKFGSTLELSSTVTFGAAKATEPLTYQWLALDAQPLPQTTTSAKLTISSFSSEHFGRYQVRVTGPGGSVLSNVLTVDDEPVYLANLSGRAFTGSGENTMIAGFVTRSRESRADNALLLRGAGPALLQYGIQQPAADPALILNTPSGSTIVNDNWVEMETAGPSFDIGAFPFTSASNDAALNVRLAAGSSSVLLSNSGVNGIALVEVYNIDAKHGPDAASALRNLSLRAQTGPGERAAIAGFVLADPLEGKRPARVLLRAVGPTLAASGIDHPLANPVLTVYDSTGRPIATNDNWDTTNAGTNLAEVIAATKAAGAFALPEKSEDAALLIDLPAGAYSMHATGGSGVVLMEIYLLN